MYLYIRQCVLCIVIKTTALTTPLLGLSGSEDKWGVYVHRWLTPSPRAKPSPQGGLHLLEAKGKNRVQSSMKLNVLNFKRSPLTQDYFPYFVLLRFSFL